MTEGAFRRIDLHQWSSNFSLVEPVDTNSTVNRRLFVDYAEIGKNSRGGDAHCQSSLQSGRWGLAEHGPICSGEAPQLRETETMGNFGDVNLVRISVAQRAVDCLQPTHQHLSGRGHADNFAAARPKGPVAHRDQLAQFGHPQRPAQMFRQDLLEPDHDPGMMAPVVSVRPGADVCQTTDQHLDQTLFNGPRGFPPWVSLGLADGPTDASQASQIYSPRVPTGPAGLPLLTVGTYGFLGFIASA
jgi:hypothetical protein